MHLLSDPPGAQLAQVLPQRLVTATEVGDHHRGTTLALYPHCYPTRKAQGLSAVIISNLHVRQERTREGVMCLLQPEDSWAFCSRCTKSCCPAHSRTTQGDLPNPCSAGPQLKSVCNSGRFATSPTLSQRK